MVRQAESFDDAAVSRLRETAGGFHRNIREQADDGGTDGRPGGKRGRERIHARTVGLGRDDQAAFRVEENPARDSLDAFDGLPHSQADILERGLGSAGRLSDGHKAIDAFDHVEKHGARGRRADVHGQKGIAFNQRCWHKRSDPVDSI